MYIFTQLYRIRTDMVGTDGLPRLQGAVDGRSGTVLRRKVHYGVTAVPSHVPQYDGQDCGRVDRYVYQWRRFRCGQENVYVRCSYIYRYLHLYTKTYKILPLLSD